MVVPRFDRRDDALPAAGHGDGRDLQHRRLQRRHARLLLDSGAPRSLARVDANFLGRSRRAARHRPRRCARDGARARVRACARDVPHRRARSSRRRSVHSRRRGRRRDDDRHRARRALCAGLDGPLARRARRRRRQRRRRAAADRRRRTGERRRPDSSPRAQDIATGHKIALAPIRAGDVVVKYGVPIGVATRIHRRRRLGALAQSAHRALGRRSTTSTRLSRHAHRSRPRRHADVQRLSPRRTARVGTRNELWVLNTVGCVNHAAERIAQAGGRTIRRRDRRRSRVRPSVRLQPARRRSHEHAARSRRV